MKVETAYDKAVAAIAKGIAAGHALWVVIGDESQRDRHWLKPAPWEGPGQYQHVSYIDGGHGLIRIPDGKKNLHIEPLAPKPGADNIALIFPKGEAEAVARAVKHVWDEVFAKSDHGDGGHLRRALDKFGSAMGRRF
jgi:hypothetical protein